jgi:uncharacterized repeat protein (TIGR01451 family)
VILGGDDLTDHGCTDSAGNPHTGWLYMQRALESLKPNVNRANDGSVAALGSADNPQVLPGATNCSNAGTAIGVAAAKAGLTVTYYDGPDAINGFFTSLAAGAAKPAMIWIAGTGAGNDLNADEAAALVTNAAAIDGFVNSGGGLFSHGTEYGWLSAILPGASTANSGGSTNDLRLTPEGAASFPGLTDGDVGAGPWHNHFEGDVGGLDVLATSATVVDTSDQPARVIIGGAQVSFTEEVGSGSVDPAPADVGVTKTASAAQVTVGGTITYTLVATNHGPGLAPKVEMTDTLPAGVTFLSLTTTRPACTFTSPKIVCALGDMSVGETATVTITVRADQTGTLPNSVVIAANVADQNVAANNYTTVNVLVVAVAAPPAAPAPAAKPKPKPVPQPKPATVPKPVVRAAECGLAFGAAPAFKGVAGAVSVTVTSDGAPDSGKRVVLTGAGTQRSAQTGADGIATFTGITPRGTLRATTAGCASISKRPVVASCSAFRVLPKGLPSGVPGTVDVRLANGVVALAGVQIHIRGAGINVSNRTAADGSAAIKIPAANAGVIVVSAPGVVSCVKRVGLIAAVEPPVTG